MNSPRITHTLAAFLSVTLLGSCTTTTSKPGREELQQKLDRTQADLAKYENKYGKLSDSKPRHDYRKLRAELLGKNMSEVVKIIGAPSKVYSLGAGRESWDYDNIAIDEITGKPVNNLEIWFTKRVVDRVEAVF